MTVLQLTLVILDVSAFAAFVLTLSAVSLQAATILVVGVVSLAACQPRQFRQPRHEPAVQPLKPG